MYIAINSQLEVNFYKIVKVYENKNSLVKVMLMKDRIM